MQNFRTQRLQNQEIENSEFSDPVNLLTHLGAIQGQDYLGTKWALGLRLPLCTDSQIEEALAQHQIVRTWLMRGTLFMTTAQDVSWLIELVGERLIQQFQRRYRQLELDEQTLIRSNEIIAQALTDHETLARHEIYDVLEAQGVSTQGQRGYHILSNTSLKGIIVQGSAPKNEPQFVLLDRLSNQESSLPRDEALARLAHLYFRSRGWVSLQDFAWWSGLLMKDVRHGFSAIEADLEEYVLGGESYYRIAGKSLNSASPSPTVYPLPGFDEYILGYKNRDVVLEPRFAERICPGKNGMFFPTIVIDGQVRGVWKRTVKKTHILIEATPFTSLTEEEETAFKIAIQRFGAFWEIPLEIRIYDV